jgi:hypothetical protein
MIGRAIAWKKLSTRMVTSEREIRLRTDALETLTIAPSEIESLEQILKYL